MSGVDVELGTYDGLDERILVVRAGDEVDSVVVFTERFNVLVDTLSTPDLCRQTLELLSKRLRNKPLLVVNSHMDWDHFWGNSALDRNTPIIAHSVAIERLGDPKSQQELVEKRALESRFADVEIIPPTMTFSGRSMSLHGGDLTLELLHTPGHTPDHVAIWIPEIKTCLAVDTVEHPIPEVWSHSPDDLRDLCASLKQIRDLNAEHVVLAHGQTANPEIVHRNIAYFTKLRDAVAAKANVSTLRGGLEEQQGFSLEDLVVLPSGLSLEARDFYRQCHRSNLNAAVAAHQAGVDFI